jgi:DNA repair protein RadC
LPGSFSNPDGELEPSEGDKDVTDRMIQVGNIVDVEVLDRLIISPVGYYSFKDHGLMNELRHSTKWVPTFIEIERIKKEALKLGEKRGLKAGKKIGLEKGLEKGRKEGHKEGMKEGEKRKAKKMAKKMKQKGYDIMEILGLTGLSKEEIEEL